MLAEGDTYQKFPDDETYPQLIVNYVKLDRVPKFDEDWSPILRAMRAGDFFVTSGELLFGKYGIEGTGAHRVFSAEVDWTFPLEFIELVWGAIPESLTYPRERPPGGVAPKGKPTRRCHTFSIFILQRG
jgi:hypothetical protein